MRSPSRREDGHRGSCGQRGDVHDPGGSGLYSHPGHLHAILTYNRDAPGTRRRHRHHAVAQSAGRRRFQVQPAPRWTGGHQPRQGSRTAPTNSCATGLKDVQRILDARLRRRPRIRATSSRRTSPISRTSSTWTRSAADLKIGVDPMGGATVRFWEPIAEPTGSTLKSSTSGRPDFLVHDRRLRRQDPHGLLLAYAMAGLIGLKDRFDIAFGNDPDVDRHGIVTRSAGLMNPNHYLAVAIWYLFQHRPRLARRCRQSARPSYRSHDRPRGRAARGAAWSKCRSASSGSSTACRRLVRFRRRRERRRFVPASDGTVWTTDKDGIILGLLAAEITAVTGSDPGEHYGDLERAFGAPVYERIDAPATRGRRRR